MDKLINDLMKLFNQRVEDLADIHSAFNAFQLMYLGESVVDMIPNIPEIVVNIAGQQCRIATSKVNAAIFGSDILFQAKPLSPEYDREAKIQTAYVQAKIAQDPANEEAITSCIANCFIYGTAIGKVETLPFKDVLGEDYNDEIEIKDVKTPEENHTVSIRSIRPDMFYPDPDIHDITRQKIVIEERYFSRSDIIKMVKAGVWEKEAYKALKEDPTSLNINNPRINTDRPYFDDEHKDMYPVLEFYEANGKHHVILNKKYLVYSKQEPRMASDKYGSPYFVFTPWIDPQSFYGIGLPHLLYSTQIEMNAMKGMLLDEKARQLNPALLLSQNALADKEKLARVEAGQIITVTGKDPNRAMALVPVNKGSLAVSLQDYQMLFAEGEKLTGVNQVMQGQQPSGRPTASGIQILNQNAHTLLDFAVRNIVRSINHMGNLVFRHVREMIMGSSIAGEPIRLNVGGGEEWFKMNAGDFNPSMDVVAGMDPNRVNPDATANKIMTFMQMVLQLASNGAYHIPPEFINMSIRKIADYLGLPAGELLGPESVMKEIFGDIDYMKRMGIPAKINANTRHDMHIMMKSPYVPSSVTEPRYYQALISNIAQHMLALQDELLMAGHLQAPIWTSAKEAEDAAKMQDYGAVEQIAGINLTLQSPEDQLSQIQLQQQAQQAMMIQQQMMAQQQMPPGMMSPETQQGMM